MDDRIWKAWLAFTEQARDGAEEMRRQWELIAGGGAGPEAIARWLAQWMPKESGMSPGDLSRELAEAVERWWEAAGMVPRAKYDAVLRQNERLRQRLEEAEAKISELRRRANAEAAEKNREETEAMLDQWQAGTREILDAQAEWTRQWVEGWLSPKSGKKEP